MEKIKVEYSDYVKKANNILMRNLTISWLSFIGLLITTIVLFFNDSSLTLYFGIATVVVLVVAIVIGTRKNVKVKNEVKEITQKTLNDLGFNGARRLGMFYKKSNKLLTLGDDLDYLEATVYDFDDFKSINIYTKPEDLTKYFDNEPGISKYVLGGALTGGIAGALVGGVIASTIDDIKGEKEVSFTIGILYQLKNGENIKDSVFRGVEVVSKLKSRIRRETSECVRFIEDIQI